MCNKLVVAALGVSGALGVWYDYRTAHAERLTLGVAINAVRAGARADPLESQAGGHPGVAPHLLGRVRGGAVLARDARRGRGRRGGIGCRVFLVRPAEDDTGAEAARGASFFYGAITAGRFLSGFLAMRFPSYVLIRAGQIICVLGAGLLMLPLSSAVAITGIVLLGLGTAPITWSTSCAPFP